LRQRLGISALLVSLWLIAATMPARADSPIDQLLQAKEAPAGVVFEVATSKDDSLNWALPLVKDYIGQIRQRFPDIHIAVVTHGREMFALQKSNSDKSTAPVRQLTQQLVQAGVSLHVCGTYAARKGLSEEDFPEYVNVAAAGPAQINDYIAVGYVRIKLKKPAQIHE
jgi:intracellular sulfur oxidation DsrE/DsrF family protein